MSHAANVKLLRKQVRNVAQETYQNALSVESIKAIDTALTEIIGEKLDKIAANVTKEVKRIDEQTQSFRGMLMRDAQMQISQEMLNLNVGFIAWQEVLVEKLGIDLTGLEAEVTAKKVAVLKRLEAEAIAAEAADKEKKALEAKAVAEATKDNVFSIDPSVETTGDAS